MGAPSQKFQDMMEFVRCMNERESTYLDGDTTYPRAWWMPEDTESWEGDPTNIESIKDAFSRAGLNELAIALYNGGATIGEIAGAELQIAYLGMMERSFRSRHMSIIRAMRHRHGRKMAHGDEAGIHTATILSHVQNRIVSGAR